MLQSLSVLVLRQLLADAVSATATAGSTTRSEVLVGVVDVSSIDASAAATAVASLLFSRQVSWVELLSG